MERVVERRLSGDAIRPPARHAAVHEFFETLGRVPPQSRDAFLAWQLERYLVPQALWSEGAWLDDYLRRRIEAARTTNDLVEAFVPVASPTRLQEAWIGRAPRPVAEPYESPQDGLLREIDALRKSQDDLLWEIDALRKSRSWRLTAPLRAIAQSVRGLGGRFQGRSRRARQFLTAEALPWLEHWVDVKETAEIAVGNDVTERQCSSPRQSYQNPARNRSAGRHLSRRG